MQRVFEGCGLTFVPGLIAGQSEGHKGQNKDQGYCDSGGLRTMI